jgi:glycerol-3-phosphate acyltransferase PlsY
LSEALAIVLAYALGSIPSGYLAGRLRGIDIRQVGSKNVGATNVFRSLGKGIGLAVMGADIAKGAAAVGIAVALTGDPWPLLAGGAAILGHVFPVWLGFRGGKGVAVTAGVAIALMPLAAAVMIPVWILIVAVTRYVSVASIAAAVFLTPVAWLFGASWPTLVFAALVSLGVLWRHRGNVQRLRRGTELRLDFRRVRRV